ncbi:MAG: sulfatase family protein [Eubacteriales bacterium]
MNVVYIHTHDTGRYIQSYGYNIPTPNLIKMTKDGTLFRNAFCAGPTCSPSRTALLTGMAPHCSDMFGLAHLGFSLSTPEKHIASFLNENGYETVLSGIQHEFGAKDILPYKKVISIPRRDYVDIHTGDILNAQSAANYINNNNGKKFFLSFGMFNTHRPFPKIENDIESCNVLPPFTVPNTKETREDMADFIESVKIADECVGIILNAIKESNIENDTVVFFTTDHGIPFPQMKCYLYDPGIAVSLIMMCPNNKQAGKSVDALISHIDIFPTLCDYLQLNKPDWLQGKSIKPILDNISDEINDEIFSEVTYHVAYEPMRCIRTKRYKLIKYFDDYEKYIPCNTDNSAGKDILNECGYFNGKREKEMMFDLYSDPVERINVVNSEKYFEIYNELSNKLKQWMLNTNDPLLKGKIQPPKGARYMKPEKFDPAKDMFEIVD